MANYPQGFPEVGQKVTILMTTLEHHDWPDKIEGVVCGKAILRHHYRLDVDSPDMDGHMLLLSKGKFGWFFDGLNAIVTIAN